VFDDARKYLTRVAKSPQIIPYLAQLYGFIGDWAVIERVIGLEGKDLGQRLQQDPQFLDKYVVVVNRIIDHMAQTGIAIDDIGFSDGRNCEVNAETAEVKFIEQTALVPREWDSSKIIGWQVDHELGAAASTVEDREQDYKVTFCVKKSSKSAN